MKTDVNGTSTCPAGEERYEAFRLSDGAERIQYDYRSAADNKLFSVVRKTLDECRQARDEWLQSRSIPEPEEMQPGRKVVIYEDPVTRDRPEGLATLIRKNTDFHDCQVNSKTMLEWWEVAFDGDPEGEHFTRRILRKNGGE